MENVDDSNERKGNEPKFLLRLMRSTLLAISVYAPLFWAYIVLRIVFNNVGLSDKFIDGVPYFSFWITGCWTFVIGFASLVAYLSIRDSSKPLINIHHSLNEESFDRIVLERKRSP